MKKIIRYKHTASQVTLPRFRLPLKLRPASAIWLSFTLSCRHLHLLPYGTPTSSSCCHIEAYPSGPPIFCVVLCFDNSVLCMNNFVLCFRNFVMCFENFFCVSQILCCVSRILLFVVFADMGHRSKVLKNTYKYILSSENWGGWKHWVTRTLLQVIMQPWRTTISLRWNWSWTGQRKQLNSF